VKVRILYPNNTTRDMRADLWEFTAGQRDKLPEGLEYYSLLEADLPTPESDNPNVVCEEVWTALNRDDIPKKCRSLSMGDIVEVDGTPYLCMAAGFAKTEPPTVSPATDYGW
jgi:hypothetical protein